MKEKLLVLKKTYQNWINNEPFEHSAVVAYYTLFSLPSLLLIIIWITGYFFEKSNVEEKLIAQISEITGPDTAMSIQSMISSAVIEEGSFITLILGRLSLYVRLDVNDAVFIGVVVYKPD